MPRRVVAVTVLTIALTIAFGWRYLFGVDSVATQSPASAPSPTHELATLHPVRHGCPQSLREQRYFPKGAFRDEPWFPITVFPELRASLVQSPFDGKALARLPTPTPSGGTKGVASPRYISMSDGLRRVQEPSLLCAEGAATEAYRVVWVPSFQPAVVVRIARSANGVHRRVIAVDENRTFPYGDGTLTEERWARVLEAVRRAAFWELPDRIDPGGGVDGETWLLEGQRRGVYRVMMVRSSGPLRSLGIDLLKLAEYPDAPRKEDG